MTNQVLFEESLDRLFERYNVSVRRRFLDEASERPIHLLEAGEGKPLLFIHGGLSYAGSFTPLFPHFKDRRILAPDRPGHGLSYRIDYSTVPDYQADAVDFMLRVVDSLGLEKVDIVANSMGGFFSAVFALAHPDRVGRLILIGAPAGIDRYIPLPLRLMGTPVVHRLLMTKTTEKKIRKIHRMILVADASRPSDEHYACDMAAMEVPGSKLAIHTMLRSVLSLRGWRPRYDIRDELARLDVPTLFAWGDNDAFAPPSSGEDLAKRMPNARFELIEDAGHLPWLDQPAECTAVIEKFLAKIRVRQEKPVHASA